jgi:hypothetical protein
MDSTNRTGQTIRLPMYNELRRSLSNHRSLSMAQTRTTLFKALLATAGSVQRWLRCPQRRAWWRNSVSQSVVLPLSRILVDMDICSETSRWGSMVSSSSAIHSGWSSSSMSSSRFIYLSQHVDPIELAYCTRQSPSSKSSGMQRKSCIIMTSKSTTNRLGKEGRAFISRGQGRTVKLGYLLSKRRMPSFMEAIGR